MKYMLMMNAPRGSGDWGVMKWPVEDLQAHIGFMKRFTKALADAGELVGAEGLAPPAQARVVRAWTNGTPAVTDGPFEEGVAAEAAAERWFAPPADNAATERDDTLILLFMCCHPALTPSSAIALTLRAVGGLTTAEIANAFLVPESTMAQRISRAKQTIKTSRVPFRMPTAREFPQRVTAVLHVLYLIFNEGYVSSVGAALQRTELASEAIRLARAIRHRLPEDPMVSLNRAVAVSMVHGPAAGLEQLQRLDAPGRLAGHYRVDAVRAHLLEKSGDLAGAIGQYRSAAAKTTSVPERDYLLTQAARLRTAAPD